MNNSQKEQNRGNLLRFFSFLSFFHSLMLVLFLMCNFDAIVCLVISFVAFF
jgi:hypothetical protein